MVGVEQVRGPGHAPLQVGPHRIGWVAARAPPSACDSRPAYSAAGQDRVAGATDARPGCRLRPGVTKQYELVRKAEISPFASHQMDRHQRPSPLLGSRAKANTRSRGRVSMSALKTLALVVLAVMLGSVTTELLAGGSALVWLVASALWTLLLLRGHRRQETHEE